MAELCRLCGARFSEPLSLIAHLASHGGGGGRLDAAYSAPDGAFLAPDGAFAAPDGAYPAPDTWRPPDDEESFGRCSPLNLAGPRQPPDTPACVSAEVGRQSGPAAGSGFEPTLAQPPAADEPCDWRLPPCATLRRGPDPPPPPSLYTAPPPPPPPEDRPFWCSRCDESFDDKQSLRAHIQQRSTDKHGVCDICGVRLGQRSSLCRHRQTHMQVRRHRCELCGRAFHRSHDLGRHRALHDKAALQCSCCRRRFTSAYHRAVHKCSSPAGGGGPQLACPVCHRTCAGAAAWGVHMWRHTKDASYLPAAELGTTPATVPASAPAPAPIQAPTLAQTAIPTTASSSAPTPASAPIQAPVSAPTPALEPEPCGQLIIAEPGPGSGRAALGQCC